VLEAVKSFFRYTPLVRKIIKQIKYQLVSEAIVDFLRIIPTSKLEELQLYNKIAAASIIIPVPLHRQRLAKRGFNQSTGISSFFANYLNQTINEAVLKRTKNTSPQVSFTSARERYLNIRGVFDLNENNLTIIKGKNFVIVDDVWTTGSTIKEICRLLKRHGAYKVFGLTVAR